MPTCSELYTYMSLSQIKEAIRAARVRYLNWASYSEIFMPGSGINASSREKMLEIAATCERALAALEDTEC